MKQLNISIAFLILFAFANLTTEAQKKGKTPVRKEVKKDPELNESPPPPPPPDYQEGINDIEADSSAKIHEMSESPIDFDTSAVIEDKFTARIRYLLSVVGAAKTDIEMAEASLTENLKGMDSTVSGPFKRKFMQEMTDGRAAIWLERLYIRTYREIFTPDEVEGMIEFYKTPLGMALLKKQPKLLQKVMMDASRIGRYLGMHIMSEIMD